MAAQGTPAADPQHPDNHPQPGPAPVGPAVRVPPQQPADTPTDPGHAPVGPAVEPVPEPAHRHA